MSSIADIGQIVATGSMAGGLILNVWVQVRASQRADANAKAQTKTLVDTKTELAEVKATGAEVLTIVGNVKENTDGRLTDVLTKFDALEISLKGKTEENAQLRIDAAAIPAIVQPRPRRRTATAIDRDIAALEKEKGDS